jgi:signal-transduction protein with cAMP-binding, CBS, and nucleotidyltransferase domain
MLNSYFLLIALQLVVPHSSLKFRVSSTAKFSNFEKSKFSLNTVSTKTQILQTYPALKPQDSVKFLLNDNFCKVFVNDTVLTAVESMNSFNKGSVIVIDYDGNLSGIFTERDFVSKVIDAQKVYAETTIDTVMTPREKLVFGFESFTLSECRQIMLKKNVRHLPILNQLNKPSGVISMREIIRSLQQEEIKRENAKFFGDSLIEIQQQSKTRANELALLKGEDGIKQDYLRGGFVLVAATIGAALLQGL